MRHRLPFFVLSLAVLACGIAAAGQDQEKKAEDVYKNIQSFKGEPASAILPAMQFISASLHVDCDYCHLEDKSSDEKEEKLTARKMIAMTRQINDDNFGGRTEITCATCHAGHTHPMSLPPLEGAGVRARRAEGLDAEQVLSAYDAAEGGSAVKAVSVEGQTVREGHSMPYSSTQEGAMIEIKEGDRSAVFNGTEGWFGRNPLPPEITKGLSQPNLLYFGRNTLPALTDPRVGTAKIDGHDVNVLSGGLGDTKERASFFFDKSNGLLVRAEYLSPTILGFLPSITNFSHYKKVNGAMVPMQVTISAESGDEVRTFKSVHINPQVDESMFHGGSTRS